MNFFECLAKGYVPPANYFKADLFSMLGISYRAWSKLYNSAKKTININETVFMKDELKETGYSQRQKLITKRQCEIIFNYIGYPDLSEKNKDFLMKNDYISEKDIENYEFK